MKHRRVWIEQDVEFDIRHPDGCRDRGTWCDDCGCCEHCFHDGCACPACGCKDDWRNPQPQLRVVEDET